MRKYHNHRKDKNNKIDTCITVRADECRGDAEKMVRKFCKKVKRDGIIDEFRDRTHFTKPSVKGSERKRAKKRLVAQVNRKRNELFTARGNFNGRRR
jgi:ribosomal protein S21